MHLIAYVTLFQKTTVKMNKLPSWKPDPLLDSSHRPKCSRIFLMTSRWSMKLILFSPEHLGQTAGLGTPRSFNPQCITGEKVSILFGLGPVLGLGLLGVEWLERN